MPSMKAVTRARNLGWITPPLLDSGPRNALTDVPGVLVGHTTLIEGDSAPLKVGCGPIRTGVTAIRPHPGNLFTEKVAAAVHVLNGFGKSETDKITQPVERLTDEQKTLGLLIQAVVEATEEAVLNSLVAAETMIGRDGHMARALPVEQVQQLIAESR